LEAEGLTPKILRLNFIAFELGDFKIFLNFNLYFIYFFSPLSASLMPVELTVD
jgi:hypothetical protein